MMIRTIKVCQWYYTYPNQTKWVVYRNVITAAHFQKNAFKT